MWGAARRVMAWAALAALGACGGGGGGSGIAVPLATAPATGDAVVPSSLVAGQCAAPRNGVDPDTGAAFPDRQGTVDSEKAWVRGWIDETYLWFDEVPTNLVAANYATPIDYFNVLKTPALTASGRPKDRFHFTADTASYRALTQSDITIGYGFELAFLSAAPPRDVRVAFLEPGSPAAQQGIVRGTKLIAIDGIDVAAGTNVAGLNAALNPAAVGESHDFTLRAPDGSERAVSLTAASITRTPVQNVKTIATAGGTVGYMLFNDHLATAEAQLIGAANQFNGAGISDLVIDMRYNGGGLLDLASELAYMVAPDAATNGTVFERMQFNRKNPFHVTTAQATLPFYSTAHGYSAPSGLALPKLGLSRVTVLTGPDTCSASESVVNSLRGVGVTVNLVGGATCGKPYGFFPQDNCGTTYFAIQFQGVNQQGFGDYGDGFAPTCAVADDFDHALGDPAEGRLAAALTLQSTGACPAAGASKAEVARSKAEAGGTPYLVRSPVREIRLVAPPAGSPG
jgi:hypothetical protein